MYVCVCVFAAVIMPAIKMFFLSIFCYAGFSHKTIIILFRNGIQFVPFECVCYDNMNESQFGTMKRGVIVIGNA